MNIKNNLCCPWPNEEPNMFIKLFLVSMPLPLHSLPNTTSPSITEFLSIVFLSSFLTVLYLLISVWSLTASLPWGNKHPSSPEWDHLLQEHFMFPFSPFLLALSSIILQAFPAEDSGSTVNKLSELLTFEGSCCAAEHLIKTLVRYWSLG